MIGLLNCPITNCPATKCPNYPMTTWQVNIFTAAPLSRRTTVIPITILSPSSFQTDDSSLVYIEQFVRRCQELIYWKRWAAFHIFLPSKCADYSKEVKKVNHYLQVYPSQKEERPISRILEIPDQNTLKKVFSQEKQMLPKTGNVHCIVWVVSPLGRETVTSWSYSQSSSYHLPLWDDVK